jgi:hypothetical protein
MSRSNHDQSDLNLAVDQTPGFCWRIRLGRLDLRIPFPNTLHLAQVPAKQRPARIRQQYPLVLLTAAPPETGW